MLSLCRLDNDHEMKWDKIKTLDIESHYYKSEYLEMLQIKSTNNTLNIQHDNNKQHL